MSAIVRWLGVVDNTEVCVEELTGGPVLEFRVSLDGEPYDVFLGNETDPGTDPDLWYTEIGGSIEGPYNTAWDCINDLYLSGEQIEEYAQ